MATNNSTKVWSEEEVMSLIQKNKELEEIIQQKETIFNEILEGSMAGYWDWFIQDDYEYLSPSFKKMFGYEDHELPNHPDSWQKIIHPDDLASVYKVFDAHVQSKGKIPYSNTVRYYHKNGSIVWVYCKGKVIQWDANNQPLRMVGSHVNITPLKNSETNLEQAKQHLIKQTVRYKWVCDNVNIGIWELDLSNFQGSWDNNMNKIYGIPEDEVAPNFEQWISKMVHPDDALQIKQHIDRVIAGDREEEIQFRIKRRDNAEERVIAAVTSVYRNKEGKPIKLVGTNLDMTRNILLERQKAKTTALEKQNKELEQFAYVTSHDLQEPLRTVDNFVGLFQKMYAHTFDEKGKIFLHHIQNATTRMSDLVKGLLDYSRIGIEKKLSNIDTKKVILEILEDIKAIIEEKGANINLQKELPTIMAYPLEIRSLFQNLIVNAIKFHKPKQKPKIEISGTESESHWIFKIKDNGIGISPKDQEKIFLIFQRLNHPKDFEGNGIGLAHCQKIADIHMGEIWVESEEGKGSTFFFSVQKRFLEEK